MAEDPVLIVPYRDGPYLVRGPAVLCDQTGAEIQTGRRVVALCRCGKSRLRPFCDGSHHLIHFRAPSEREDRVTDESHRPPRREEAGNRSRDLEMVQSELMTLRDRLTALREHRIDADAEGRVADAARLMAAASAALAGAVPPQRVRGPR